MLKHLYFLPLEIDAYRRKDAFKLGAASRGFDAECCGSSVLGFPLVAMSTVEARIALVIALITEDPVLQRKSLLSFLL